MIGRADIEGSKSNVDLNSWLQQASYPYGNFSDTSSIKKMVIFRTLNILHCCNILSSKGSIGHIFIIIVFTEHYNKTHCLAFSSTQDFCS